MSTEKILNKKVVLTTAQFEQRRAAGTLAEGVEYCISDAKDAVEGITVNGTSIVDATTHIANIPYAANDDLNGGIVKLSNAGIVIDGNTHILKIVPASYIALNSGAGNYAYHPVCASATGLATKKALGITLDSSTSNSSWTDGEKSTARNTIGAATSEIVADWDNLRTL